MLLALISTSKGMAGATRLVIAATLVSFNLAEAGLLLIIGIGQWFRFYNKQRPHQALGYTTPAAVWAAEVSPMDLPLRLDDAGASPTTPQGQPQQNVVSI